MKTYTMVFVDTDKKNPGGEIEVSPVQVEKIDAEDIDDAAILANKKLTPVGDKVPYLLRIESESGNESIDFYPRVPQEIRDVCENIISRRKGKEPQPS